jgi:hypothetical protein
MEPRVKREDPERVEPIRAWETLFRADEAQPKPDAGQPDSSAKNEKSSWDEIASRAVRRGYEVIEEQINEGRKIAEKVRGYSDDVRKVNDDSTRLIERSLRFYTDVGYLWFELMESLLRNQALRPDGLRPSNGANGANGADAHAENRNGNGSSGGQHNDVEIELISPYPTTVSLDLRSTPDAMLSVPALRAADDSKPPLADIAFHDGAARPVLRIKIPEGQPADTYSGVVVDARTHQPRGTLCVSVRDAAAAT